MWDPVTATVVNETTAVRMSASFRVSHLSFRVIKARCMFSRWVMSRGMLPVQQPVRIEEGIRG